MRDCGEPLISHLDLAVGHGVDLSFFYDVKPFGGWLFEHRGLDLSVLSIHEIHWEQISFALIIVPLFHWILSDHFHFDYPVLDEVVEAAERQIFLIRRIDFFVGCDGLRILHGTDSSLVHVGVIWVIIALDWRFDIHLVEIQLIRSTWSFILLELALSLVGLLIRNSQVEILRERVVLLILLIIFWRAYLSLEACANNLKWIFQDENSKIEN